MRDCHDGLRRLGRSLRLRGGRRSNRSMASARGRFVFLLLRQDGLERIARLGDVRKVNLGLNGLRCPGCRGPCMSGRPCAALEMRAHLVGFVQLQGTGVGLAFTKAELRQYVKNLPALDFHLACEIVDSYLAHPPLFTLCYPKPP
jgi:hypothetical protein